MSHTGLEALPSKKKLSIDGTVVPGFLRCVWCWDRVAKPQKMGKKLNLVNKLVKNTKNRALKGLIWFGMVWSCLSCDPRSNLTCQNHKLLSKCPRK